MHFFCSGLLTIMLILGLSTCVLCCYKRCQRRLSQNETAVTTTDESAGITSSLMVHQPMPQPPRVIRSTPNNGQFQPRVVCYAQMAKNATTKDAQPI